MRISNFEELIATIEANDFTLDEINTITKACIGSLFVHSHTKEDYMNILISEWQKRQEKEFLKAILLDVDPITE